MLKTYRYPKFEYRRPPELDAAATWRPVIVVGAGSVGISAAIDLRRHGVPGLLLDDDDDTVSMGSRGVCYAKRTLEIFDRLGVGDLAVIREALEQAREDVAGG